jgi:hypothetical protein
VKKSVFALFILAATIGLTACGSKEESPAALETAREVANANSKFNAIKWRGENGFEATSILGRGDSTQQPKCPQGDGWATIDLLNPATKQVALTLKCSTYSSNVGCSKAEDFKARPQLAAQENTCSAQVPYPFKKLEG